MQRAEIDLEQHRHDHQPDQHRDRDVDLGQGHAAERLKRSRYQPAQHDAGKDALEAKAQALMSASQKLGEAMYAKAQAEAQTANAGEAGAAGGGKESDEKVVDAEFTEVKDKK